MSILIDSHLFQDIVEKGKLTQLLLSLLTLLFDQI